jgi:hypothetical protein
MGEEKRATGRCLCGSVRYQCEGNRLADGLVDHIISASQQAGRHFKAKRLRGLEID